MKEQGKLFLSRYGPVGLIYLLATGFTDAQFMGDTADYIHSVFTGKEFWEFGHLCWRPLGWLLFQVLRTPASWIVGANSSAQMAAIFIALSWASGLLSVLLLHSLLLRYTKQRRIAILITAAFIFSQAFLNFSQTGAPYIPGLSFVLLALFLLLSGAGKSDYSWKIALGAGLALALAICLWFPYVWAIPAVLMAPMVIAETSLHTSLRLMLRTTLVFSLATLLAYMLVILRLGITDLAGLRDWVAASSHGMNLTGLPRVLFGLVRSFIDLGNDGIVFKRYVLHDPYSPTGMVDLLRAGGWKLAFFYLALVAMLVSLWRSGKRFLLLLLINAIPLLGFALIFDGGSAERYLPLYPVLFISTAFCLAQNTMPGFMRVGLLLFFLASATTNLSVLNIFALSDQQQVVINRIDRLPVQLAPQSKLFVIDEQDELLSFNRNFFFNSTNQEIGLITRPVVLLNTKQVDTWMADFAEELTLAWNAGGDVWLSKRLFSEVPSAQWNWVEGADPRLRWRDLYGFFARLETGEGIGEKDGFVRLLSTEYNKLQVFGNRQAVQRRLSDSDL